MLPVTGITFKIFIKTNELKLQKLNKVSEGGLTITLLPELRPQMLVLGDNKKVTEILVILEKISLFNRNLTV